MDKLFNNLTLRDIIRMKYRTYTEFAGQIGWNKQKLDYKLKNPASIDVTDAKQLADTLGVEFDSEFIKVLLRT